MNDLSAYDSENGFDTFDCFFRHGEVIRGQDREIRKLPLANRAFFVVFAREPGTAERVAAERLKTIQAIGFRVQRRTAAQPPAGAE